MNAFLRDLKKLRNSVEEKSEEYSAIEEACADKKNNLMQLKALTFKLKGELNRELNKKTLYKDRANRYKKNRFRVISIGFVLALLCLLLNSPLSLILIMIDGFLMYSKVSNLDREYVKKRKKYPLNDTLKNIRELSKNVEEAEAKYFLLSNEIEDLTNQGKKVQAEIEEKIYNTKILEESYNEALLYCEDMLKQDDGLVKQEEELVNDYYYDNFKKILSRFKNSPKFLKKD